MAQNSSSGSSNIPSVQRLPSWKAPRDLTLASLSSHINLKSTNPNTNSKKQFVPNLNVQRKKNTETFSSPRIKSQVEDASHMKRDKKNQRFKKEKELVQTKSVFSDGLAASDKKSRSSFSFKDGQGTSKANLPQPKLNLERNIIADKTIDDKTLHDLLRDDFIDDDDYKEDIKYSKAPVQLPLKYDILECKSKINEILVNEKSEDEPRFLFFQFPDSIAVPSTTPDNKETASYSMKDIHPGRLGTIQIMKSGKVRLVQGDKIYNISQSTKTTFHQDVVSCQTNAETKTGVLASLGPVSSRFIVTPDWNSLLS